VTPPLCRSKADNSLHGSIGLRLLSWPPRLVPPPFSCLLPVCVGTIAMHTMRIQGCVPQSLVSPSCVSLPHSSDFDARFQPVPCLECLGSPGLLSLPPSGLPLQEQFIRRRNRFVPLGESPLSPFTLFFSLAGFTPPSYSFRKPSVFHTSYGAHAIPATDD